jgi:hypothetical protein
MGSCKSVFVGDMKHLEEESEILNVVGIIVVVDIEPKDGVRLRVDVSYRTGSPSAWDEDGRRISACSFRRHQTKVIVPLRVGVFQLVQLLDIIYTKLIKILSDIRRKKVRDVSLVNLTIPVGRNQVIRFRDAKEFAQAKGHTVVVLAAVWLLVRRKTA